MLSRLELSDFRSHASFSLEPAAGLTVLRGQNGSGKTNALDAAYLLLNARAYGGRAVPSLVRDGAAGFSVSGDVDGRRFTAAAEASGRSANFLVDRRRVTRPAYLAASATRAAYFSNQELNVLYLEPGLRRDFLDEHLDLADPSFSGLKSDYAKVVRHRNKLLGMVAERRASPEDLGFWDAKVASLGARYGARRRELADFLSANARRAEAFFDAAPGLSVSYASKVPAEGAEAWILGYLKENRERDVILGRTCAGPHVDDLSVTAGPRAEPVGERLSRGECKAVFLALKFLAAEFLAARRPGERLVYLLDDLFSELDPRRCRRALEWTEGSQAVVTAQDGIFPDLGGNPKFIDI